MTTPLAMAATTDSSTLDFDRHLVGDHRGDPVPWPEGERVARPCLTCRRRE